MSESNRDGKILSYAPVPPVKRPRVTLTLLWEIIVFPVQILIGCVIAGIGYGLLTWGQPTEAWMSVGFGLMIVVGIAGFLDAFVRLWAATRTLRGLPAPQARWYMTWMKIQRRWRI